MFEAGVKTGLVKIFNLFTRKKEKKKSDKMKIQNFYIP